MKTREMWPEMGKYNEAKLNEINKIVDLGAIGLLMSVRPFVVRFVTV